MRIGDKFLFAGLIIIDRLFATNLVERELARRKAKLARYEAYLTQITEALTKFEESLKATHLQLCLLYLRQRELLLPHRWLHFDPASHQEDQGLDLLIDYLVKPRLAAIEVQEVKNKHYIYKLEPDWAAINAFLAEWQADLQPEIAEWLTQKKGF
jgi:hypothetical protein